MLRTDDLNNLVDRIDHELDPLSLHRELLDYQSFYLTRTLLNEIANCVGVRIWICTRKEQNMRGQLDIHHFYSVFGLREDVETACWLFECIEETVGELTAEYVNKYIFSTSDKKIMLFQAQQVQQIREQLQQIVDYNHDEKEAIIAPAFLNLNIKITKTKAVIHAPQTHFTSLNIA